MEGASNKDEVVVDSDLNSDEFARTFGRDRE